MHRQHCLGTSWYTELYTAQERSTEGFYYAGWQIPRKAGKAVEPAMVMITGEYLHPKMPHTAFGIGSRVQKQRSAPAAGMHTAKFREQGFDPVSLCPDAINATRARHIGHIDVKIMRDEITMSDRPQKRPVTQKQLKSEFDPKDQLKFFHIDHQRIEIGGTHVRKPMGRSPIMIQMALLEVHVTCSVSTSP